MSKYIGIKLLKLIYISPIFFEVNVKMLTHVKKQTNYF